jgi:hypothetical protein
MEPNQLLSVEALLAFFAAGVISPIITQVRKSKRWPHSLTRSLCIATGGFTGLLAWLIGLAHWYIAHQPLPPEQWPAAPHPLAMIGAGLLAGGAATTAVAGWKATQKRPAARRRRR